MTRLETERLTLTPPHAGDIEAIVVACSDPEVARWTATIPSPYGREHAEEYIRLVDDGWRDGTSLVWAIREKGDTGLLGVVGIHGIEHGKGEIGFWMSARHRGLGYMSEAVAAVRDHALSPAVGLTRLSWHAIVGNYASAAIARRTGFRFEGTRRLGGVQRGTLVSDWCAAILSSDDPAESEAAATWPAETFPQ